MADANAIYKRVTKKFADDGFDADAMMSAESRALSKAILLSACVIAEAITNGIE